MCSLQNSIRRTVKSFNLVGTTLIISEFPKHTYAMGSTNILHFMNRLGLRMFLLTDKTMDFPVNHCTCVVFGICIH